MATINFTGTAGTSVVVPGGYTLLGGGFTYYSDGLGVVEYGVTSEIVSDVVVSGSQRYTAVIDLSPPHYWSRAGIAFVDPITRTGVKVYLYQEGATLVIQEQVAGADGASIASTSVGASGLITLDVDFNSTSGAITVFINATQVLTGTFAGTKTNLRAGIHAASDGTAGPSIRSLTTPAGASVPVIDDINTNEQVRVGSSGNTITTSNLGTLTSLAIGSKSATSLSATGGDGTFSMPTLSDGVAYELMGINTATAGDGTSTADISVTLLPLSTQDYVTLSGTLNTTNTGVLYNFSPAAVVGDQIVFLTASNTSVDAQGNLATDLVGTQQMWHIQASTKVARSYDVTTGESAGLTVSITGVAGTGAVGTVTPSLGATGLTVTITGVAGAGTVGTVVPSLGSGEDITVAISGVAGTGTVGTVTTTLTDYIVRVSTDLPKFIVSVAKSIRRSFKKSFRKK